MHEPAAWPAARPPAMPPAVPPGMCGCAIRDIASVFNIASTEIERKLKNLSSHYFREKRKFEESKRSGSGRDDVQLPKWFAYKALSFLNDKNAPVPTLNSHTPSSSQDNITPQTTLPSTRTSRKRNIEREPEVDEALQLLREITSNARQRDDAAIFADYISSKLRKMDHYTMCTVQHQIQNIIYEAEMRMGSMNFDTSNGASTHARRHGRRHGRRPGRRPCRRLMHLLPAARAAFGAGGSLLAASIRSGSVVVFI
ncbi:uncharacterized protein LOC120636901 [Pararge aegeria]|uniref:uncharacterized protein LOC120636901 n=1 Tax=Pararge aegeria TaxID=116150 RepID=UPI0019D0FC2B|nr:uncharacterized protein LOC120636901 [Pararge aegeria]